MYSLDKICESNNDCSDSEVCDSSIGICVCSNGFQLDDTKKFCLPNTGSMGSGFNISSYDTDEISNINQQQQQLDTTKKVKKSKFNFYFNLM